MTPTKTLSKQSTAWRAGLSAALFLGLSVPAVGLAALPLSELFRMGHNMANVGIVILVAMLLVGCGLAGGLWGRSLARLAGLPNARRVAWASGLAFGPLTVVAILGLTRGESLFVEERLAGAVPIHIVFAVLFTLSAFFVTGGTALAAGWAARGWRYGLQSGLWAGLAAALAFLLSDQVQDALGRRVGAPRAEETATMLTVALLGNVIAAFAGGAVMAWRLRAGQATAPTTQLQTSGAIQ
ncbi:MAG: hypothetical protein ABI847_04045 [Anaerolineales bacterium]